MRLVAVNKFQVAGAKLVLLFYLHIGCLASPY